jgi:hypothetical protein
MPDPLDMTLHLLDYAYRQMASNLETVSLQEALFVPAGGYRSILGTLKHAAGWSHVYRSCAFDAHPRGWREIDWPHGLRDTILPSQGYWEDLKAWFDQSHRLWVGNLESIEAAQLDQPRPLHWGEKRPLYEIVVMIAGHHTYHAGELNQALSIVRGEAWEEGEEVEENHISTLGHRVRPLWND